MFFFACNDSPRIKYKFPLETVLLPTDTPQRGYRWVQDLYTAIYVRLPTPTPRKGENRFKMKSPSSESRTGIDIYHHVRRLLEASRHHLLPQLVNAG